MRIAVLVCELPTQIEAGKINKLVTAGCSVMEIFRTR
jgi:hypothetical protein